MRLNTVRFGEVEVDEGKILDFGEGLPGLEGAKKYAILRFEESYPILWLQSTEDESICIPVIDTFLAFPGYAFDLGDSDVKALELASPEDLYVLSVLVIPENIEQMTANLVAPIVMNTKTGRAKQVIVEGSDYNVRFPVFPFIYKLVKEGEADAGSLKKAE